MLQLYHVFLHSTSRKDPMLFLLPLKVGDDTKQAMITLQEMADFDSLHGS